MFQVFLKIFIFILLIFLFQVSFKILIFILSFDKGGKSGNLQKKIIKILFSTINMFFFQKDSFFEKKKLSLFTFFLLSFILQLQIWCVLRFKLPWCTCTELPGSSYHSYVVSVDNMYSYSRRKYYCYHQNAK